MTHEVSLSTPGLGFLIWKRRARIRLWFGFVLAFVGILSGEAAARATTSNKVSPGDKGQLTKFVTQLQDEKDRAEDYVLRAKQIEDEDNRDQAHRLYVEAETDFNHYITQIFNGVRLGSSVDLRASAESATSSASAFENYVAANTKTKSPLAVISAAQTVLAIATNIFGWFDKTKKITTEIELQKLRHETADYWQPRLQWRPWERISAGE